MATSKITTTTFININNMEVGVACLKLREPKPAKPATAHKEQAACDEN